VGITSFDEEQLGMAREGKKCERGGRNGGVRKHALIIHEECGQGSAAQGEPKHQQEGRKIRNWEKTASTKSGQRNRGAMSGC